MTDPKAVRNVIFDLGGVVLEWNPTAIARELTHDPQEQQTLVRDVFTAPEWLELDRGTMTEAETIARFARRTKRSIEAMTEVMRVADRSMQLRPGTIDLMKDLAAAGYPLYCLSNMPIDRAAYLRRTHDFWGMFRGIVISGHLNMVKPEPEIYEHLLTTYALKPSSCLFLDDSPRNVEGARAVGIQSLVFTDAAACRKLLAPLLG